MENNFWHNKKVFVTGHTGFKGAWLSLLLQELGAKVTGYSLEPPTHPNLFEVAQIAKNMTSVIGDVNSKNLYKALAQSQPDIVLHLAAQSLVRYSYENPIETYQTNVMGTAHLLEAIRHCSSVRAVVVVTSDKCYENQEWDWGYRENEPMGGHDPYSSSKGCVELLTASFRQSFFSKKEACAIATARAGNVIGGGDWAQDRLVPDLIHAFSENRPPVIRNPTAIRPWQHVLEPLSGYLLLASKLYEEGQKFAQAWNFGPSDSDAKPVSWISEKLAALYKFDAQSIKSEKEELHEAHYLKLDSSKAKHYLSWYPRWNLETTLHKIFDWHAAHKKNTDMNAKTIEQIRDYLNSKN